MKREQRPKKMIQSNTFNRIDEYLLSLFFCEYPLEITVHYFASFIKEKENKRDFVRDLKMLFYKCTVQVARNCQ
jgi:hypothetical protein